MAIFDGDHLPAHGGENIVDTFAQTLGDNAVQALPVVIDHPPGVAQVMFPALQQGFVDIAFVELAVTDQSDHAALGAMAPIAGVKIVLDQAGETGHGHTQAHGTGRKIDVVTVLGARWIGLRAAKRAKALKLVAGLMTQKILDRMEHRAGVRLHRHPILGAQGVEIQRRRQGGDRGAGGLMAADLQLVVAGPHVVGVVDHPTGQPQHFAFKLPQAGQFIGGRQARRGVCQIRGHPRGHI